MGLADLLSGGFYFFLHNMRGLSSTLVEAGAVTWQAVGSGKGVRVGRGWQREQSDARCENWGTASSEEWCIVGIGGIG